LSKIYIEEKQFDKALDLLQEALTLSDRFRAPDYRVYHYLGDIYLEKDDLDLALENYSQAVGLRDSEDILEKFHSVYKQKYGNMEGARKFLNQKILALTALKKPYPAPDFTLSSVEGESFNFGELRGKVVLVSVWNPG